MKKINKLLFLILILSNLSCSFEKEKEVVFEVTADYGNINEGEITYLLDDCIPFFDSKEYGFDLVLGMKISVTYNGDLIKQETHPATVETSKLKILDVEYENPKVYNYFYGQVPGAGLNCTVYPQSQEQLFEGNIESLEFVILENNKYTLINELKPNQSIYLITSTTDDKENARGFYSFNPI